MRRDAFTNPDVSQHFLKRKHMQIKNRGKVESKFRAEEHVNMKVVNAFCSHFIF